MEVNRADIRVADGLGFGAWRLTRRGRRASVPGQQLAAAAWMMHSIVVRHRLKRLNHNPRHSQDGALGPRERQQLMRRRNARLSMNIAVRVA
jgi:hypothetical protein